MVVQHNMQAMNSNRMLGVTTSSQGKTTEKLSSGYKINRAADDAAGLAISEKMRKQARGLERGSMNAQDGVSCVQTAEGALNEVHAMLQRMNELAVQAANGTNSESDRQAIQNEVDQLLEEMDRVSETTKFNETMLLKGDPTGATRQVYMNLHTAGLDRVKISEGIDSYGNPIGIAEIGPFYDGDKVKIGDYEYTIQGGGGGGTIQELHKAEGEKIIGYSAAMELMLSELAKANAIGVAKATHVEKDDNSVHGLYVFQAYEDGSDIYIEAGGGWSPVEPYHGTLNIRQQSVTCPKPLSFNLHAGADADLNNKITVDIEPFNTKFLGIQKLDVIGDDGDGGITATYAIDAIKDALQKVSDQRAELGAIQNRLEHSIANLDNVVENTTAAESRIRDTDMAEAMVEYSKNNILAQAGQSMLAQANSSAEGVMALLQ